MAIKCFMETFHLLLCSRAIFENLEKKTKILINSHFFYHDIKVKNICLNFCLMNMSSYHYKLHYSQHFCHQFPFICDVISNNISKEIVCSFNFATTTACYFFYGINNNK